MSVLFSLRLFADERAVRGNVPKNYFCPSAVFSMANASLSPSSVNRRNEEPERPRRRPERVLDRIAHPGAVGYGHVASVDARFHHENPVKVISFPLIQKLQQFRDDASVRILGSTSFHASCSRYGRLMLPPAESRQTSVVAWQAFRSSRICSERSGRLG